MTPNFPLAAEPFMPHRSPMRLVERLLSCCDDRAQVETMVDRTTVLVDSEGELEPLAGVELLAQAQAVAQGFRDQVAGKPVKMGYLVAVSQFEYVAPAPLGEPLMISVVTKSEFGDFAVVEGEIKSGGVLLARGKLKLWIANDQDGGGHG